MFSTSAEKKPFVLTPETLTRLKEEAQKLNTLKEQQEGILKQDESIKDSIQKLKDSIKPAIEVLEEKRKELGSKLRNLDSEIYNIQHNFDEKSKIHLFLSKPEYTHEYSPIIKQFGDRVIRTKVALPMGLPTEINVDELSELLMLIYRKFDVVQADVKMDVLDPKNIELIFSQHNVVKKEVQENGLRFFDKKIEADDAIKALRPLASNYSPWNRFDEPKLTLSRDKLQSVIALLKSKDDLSAAEIESRKSRRGCI